MKKFAFFLALALFLIPSLAFPPIPAGNIDTVAGDGTGAAGFSGDGGSATSAKLAYPSAHCLTSNGDIIIADTSNDRIRRVDRNTQVITTIATIIRPVNVAVDSNGHIYASSHRHVWKIDAVTGAVSTYAGGGSPPDGFGDGGPATDGEIHHPCGLAFDSADNLYLAEDDRDRIRRVDAVTGIITTYAGTGVWGFAGDGGPAIHAEFRFPTYVEVDSQDNLYIADLGNDRIRRIDVSTGIISTVVGGGTPPDGRGDGGLAANARLTFPLGMAFDDNGNFYFVDDNRVRRVDGSTQVITTIAGTGANDYTGDGGPALAAAFDFASEAAIDADGNLFITDFHNSAIRRVNIASAVNTPAGMDIEVLAGDDLTVTFDSVMSEGQTSATEYDRQPPGLPDSAAFQFLWSYYDITTTAEFEGTITIEIGYDDSELTPEEEENLVILHYDETTQLWTDVTVSLDTVANIITAETTSFSFFAAALRDLQPSFLRPLRDGTTIDRPSGPHKQGRTIPVKVEILGLGGEAISDLEALYLDVELQVFDTVPGLPVPLLGLDPVPMKFEPDSGRFQYNVKTKGPGWIRGNTYRAVVYIDGAESGEVHFSLR